MVGYNSEDLEVQGQRTWVMGSEPYNCRQVCHN